MNLRSSPRNHEGWRWFMAQVPVTTAPADPKDDAIPLSAGLASSFFVRDLSGRTYWSLRSFISDSRRAEQGAAADRGNGD